MRYDKTKTCQYAVAILHRHTSYSTVVANEFRVWTCSEYFAVDAGSGELSIARQIDRDDVCYDESTSVCRLTLDVALLRPASLFRAFQIHVDVLDLNDNDPVFNVEDYVLTIPESVSPGIVISAYVNVVTLFSTSCRTLKTLWKNTRGAKIYRVGQKTGARFCTP